MRNASTSARPEENKQIHARLTDVGMHSHERSNRLFSLSDLWYFRTREGKDVGPLRYQCEAEAMLARFVGETSRLLKSSLMPHKLHFRTCGIIGRRQAS